MNPLLLTINKLLKKCHFFTWACVVDVAGCVFLFLLLLLLLFGWGAVGVAGLIARFLTRACATNAAAVGALLVATVGEFKSLIFNVPDAEVADICLDCVLNEQHNRKRNNLYMLRAR